MTELTPAFAGQVVVTVILGLAAAGAVLFLVSCILLRVFGDKLALGGAMEDDEIVESPSDLAPLPADNALDDDEQEDFEHMRVVREAAAS